jgi:hypothetical protein
VPVPGEYDHDGVFDFAVFRSSYGGWFIDTNRNGGTDLQTIFGMHGDVPAQGRYEVAGSPWDLGIYRPSEGRLSVDTTYEGEPNIETAIGGQPGDVPLRLNGWIHDALGVR